MHPLHDPWLASTHHRQLIAQREGERFAAALRRQQRARRLMRRAEKLNRQAAAFTERLF